MTPDVVAGLIALGGVVVSTTLSTLLLIFSSGVQRGVSNTRLERLEKDVAEIKGMFRMTLRDPGTS